MMLIIENVCCILFIFVILYFYLLYEERVERVLGKIYQKEVSSPEYCLEKNAVVNALKILVRTTIGANWKNRFYNTPIVFIHSVLLYNE